jgi:diacylglycerol kinase (ATP)
MTQLNIGDSAATLKSTGIFKRLFKAFKYGLQGFQAAWTYEAAFRTELWVFLLAIVILAITPSLTLMQYAVLLGVWVLVMVIELLNSAIEAVVDLISPNIHPLAGRAKDLGSAAVLLTVTLAMVVWGVLIIPIWWHLLR